MLNLLKCRETDFKINRIKTALNSITLCTQITIKHNNVKHWLAKAYFNRKVYIGTERCWCKSGCKIRDIIDLTLHPRKGLQGSLFKRNTRAFDFRVRYIFVVSHIWDCYTKQKVTQTKYLKNRKILIQLKVTQFWWKTSWKFCCSQQV